MTRLPTTGSTAHGVTSRGSALPSSLLLSLPPAPVDGAQHTWLYRVLWAGSERNLRSCLVTVGETSRLKIWSHKCCGWFPLLSWEM